MDVKDLTPEQIKKVVACETGADVVAFVRNEGVELTPDQLDAIAGGWDSAQRRKDLELESALESALERRVKSGLELESALELEQRIRLEGDSLV